MNSPIAILTDFGTADPFVGIMKGVITDIVPQTLIIDLTHEIPPGDVRRAAIVLWQSRPYFPKGTIFLAVIDPGVGTARRPIILETTEHTFVGPDNGLFTFIMDGECRAWKLSNPELALPNPHRTFHGRDIFAPAAAYAARGVPGPKFGAALPGLQRVAAPKLDSQTPGMLQGEILHADRFGNLLTSLGIFDLDPAGCFDFRPWLQTAGPVQGKFKGLRLPNGDQLQMAKTFAEIPAGECSGIIGSSGLIEIAANRQSAANLLDLQPGEPVALHFR